MTNQRRIFGIPWYKFVTNKKVATFSQLPSTNEAICQRIDTLFGHVKRMDQAAPAKQALSQSRHDRAQDSLVSGDDNQAVHENAGWNRSPRAQGSLLLMLAWSVATDRQFAEIDNAENKGQYVPFCRLKIVSF